MHSTWLRSTFLRVLKFLKIKKKGPNFLGNQFCRKPELFGRPFFVSILKVSWTQIHGHSLDFNAFCTIQEYFSQISKFLQIKEGGPNSWGEPILHKVWIIFSPVLYFFKSFIDPVSSSFIRFCPKSGLFGPLFCISILKVFWTQIHSYSLDFNAFWMIQEYFPQSL